MWLERGNTEVVAFRAFHMQRHLAGFPRPGGIKTEVVSLALVRVGCYLEGLCFKEVCEQDFGDCSEGSDTMATGCGPRMLDSL